mmetsp:Transcript_7695/g.18495  ORF Transcript_7695/g.18495 Transcript_7695/m.18495 type:complete len:248 (-) Transcript_7695:745-1488(-)
MRASTIAALILALSSSRLGSSRGMAGPTSSVSRAIVASSFPSFDSDTAVLSSDGTMRSEAPTLAGRRTTLAGAASSQEHVSASCHGSDWPKTPTCSPEIVHRRTVQSAEADTNASTPLRYSRRTTAHRCARHEKTSLMAAWERGCTRDECSTRSEMSHTLTNPPESPVNKKVLVSSAQTCCSDSLSAHAPATVWISRPACASQNRMQPSAETETRMATRINEHEVLRKVSDSTAFEKAQPPVIETRW